MNEYIYSKLQDIETAVKGNKPSTFLQFLIFVQLCVISAVLIEILHKM